MDPDTLRLASGQHAMFEHLTAGVAEGIGMDPMKVRGFLWRSIKDWQHQEQRSISELADLDPAERVRLAREITDMFGAKMLAVLPSHQHELFKDALQNVWQTYRARYSMRQPGTRPDV